MTEGALAAGSRQRLCDRRDVQLPGSWMNSFWATTKQQMILKWLQKHWNIHINQIWTRLLSSLVYIRMGMVVGSTAPNYQGRTLWRMWRAMSCLPLWHVATIRNLLQLCVRVHLHHGQDDSNTQINDGFAENVEIRICLESMRPCQCASSNKVRK